MPLASVPLPLLASPGRLIVKTTEVLTCRTLDPNGKPRLSRNLEMVSRRVGMLLLGTFKFHVAGARRDLHTLGSLRAKIKLTWKNNTQGFFSTRS